MERLAKGIWRDEEGATAVEYGLIVALIAVVIIVAVRSLGTSISAKFVPRAPQSMVRNT